ncbi:MAG: septum site-determining protein MinD [Oscillospiraceae bacterium]|jgi:septum site-determining protein MinD|nr:septum site-determining protein MinD [Oscillospiraceae bacterium]MCI9587020.1 septum site-determining protein MinD [Oscillospiraceae bacterium]
MGQNIAVVSGKGGTGKTSLVAHVGLNLAALGNRVLCLDCDVGLRNLDIALGMSDCGSTDFTDVLAGRCTLEEGVIPHPIQKNLFLLTAPLTIQTPVDVGAFGELMAAVEEQYDYCLVDAPAGLGDGFRLSITGSSRAIVVTTTDPTSLRDAQRTVMELSHLGDGKVHLVVNRCKRKLLRSLHQTIDDAIDAAGLPLLGVIPEDEDLPLALGRGVPLTFVYNRCAGAAYAHIARRLTGEKVSLLRIR